MIVTYCDRCGTKIPNTSDIIQAHFPSFFINKKSYYGSSQIELCADCSKELEKWLDNEELEEYHAQPNIR